MSVELKAGLWGVSRDKRVWGPFQDDHSPRYPIDVGHGSECWTRKGRLWVLWESPADITHTFPTEAAAKAFASGKPVKEINYQRLALRMSKAPTIREARGMYERAVGK